MRDGMGCVSRYDCHGWMLGPLVELEGVLLWQRFDGSEERAENGKKRKERGHV